MQIGRDWETVVLHDRPASSTEPLTQAVADELLLQLAGQEDIMPAQIARIHEARTAVHHATALSGAYSELEADVRLAMAHEEGVRNTRLAKVRSDLATTKAERGNYLARLERAETDFALAASQCGLAVADPGSPEQVQGAAFHLHGGMQLVQNAPVAIVPEASTEEEPASSDLQETPNPVAPQPSSQKRSSSPGAVFMEALATVTTGFILSFTLGSLAGFVSEEDLSTMNQVATIAKMVIILLVGVGVAWAVSTFIQKVMADVAKPREDHSIRPQVRMTYIWLGIILLLMLAELTAGTLGLQTFMRGLAAQQARMGVVVPVYGWWVYSVAAALFSLPLFVYKGIKGYQQTRREVEDSEVQRVKSLKEIEAQEAKNRLIETAAARKREETLRQREAVAAHQQQLVAVHARVRSWFETTPVAQNAMRASYEIASARLAIQAADTRLESLLRSEDELNKELKLDPMVKQRLEEAYAAATAAAAKVHELCSPA